MTEAATLTPKQEAFAQAYVELGNASEAYRKAYEVGPMTKADVVHVKASELLGNGKVTVRVAEIKAAAASRSAMTLDRLNDMMLAAYNKAMNDPKGASAAVAASNALGKLHGLITDRLDQKTTVAGNLTVSSTVVDRPPEETREEWLARRNREIAAAAAPMGASARPAN